MDGLSRVTDLIPRSNRVYWAIGLAGCAVVGLLVILYASWVQWDLWGGWGFVPSDGRIAALDLDGEGSLAVWFSSAVLFVTAQVTLLIGWVRTQNPNDYAGRYRIWFWAALMWLVLSVDETASLHEGFKELMSGLIGTRIWGDGSIWWAVPYAGILLAVGVRLLWEMRACWASCAILQATGWLWALAVATQLGLVLPASGARGVMLEESCEMLGNVTLFLSMLIHARWVVEEVESSGGRQAAYDGLERHASRHRSRLGSRSGISQG